MFVALQAEEGVKIVFFAAIRERNIGASK